MDITRLAYDRYDAISPKTILSMIEKNPCGPVPTAAPHGIGGGK